MLLIESILIDSVKKCIQAIYGAEINTSIIQLQKTRKEFEGDITLVVFPFLKVSKKSLEQTANEIGRYLKEKLTEVKSFNVIKGFLNISVSDRYWIDFLEYSTKIKDYEIILGSKKQIMVEFSSPNTNKPLHLGHIRNNLLGYSISNILESVGYKVIKANLVNDRGIHICKSMLAWQKWGNGITPEKAGIKGDHFVGDFYVLFDKEYKKQINELKNNGLSEDEALKNAPLILEAQEMLRKWEAGDEKIVNIWKKMNKWVYAGFNETYIKLGVDFDRIYYESETYLLGKKLVFDGEKKGVLVKNEDSSIGVDLSSEGLDYKILLRSDGTSVYMTQDIGTAHQRFTEYHPLERIIYVVGNEQNYHFQALSIVLKKLGFDWYDKIEHLAYGMVELPEGKMKSREGTVVDADDLIDEMIKTARQMSDELGKLEGINEDEKENIIRIIGLGALKYFILKVDPKKNMTFDPKESIDFNGNTGPFIQYTYARIRSVMRKAEEQGIKIDKLTLSSEQIGAKEKELIKLINDFSGIIAEAANVLNPAFIANYAYDLAKEYNQFYHDQPILKVENVELRNLRILLSKKIAEVLKTGMGLLGIEMPERM